MLPDAIKTKVREEMAHYEDGRAACIDAMKMVQRQYGWVSDEHLHDLAEVLNMTVDELDSVATFYSLIFRREVGRHVILVCDSISCWILGYKDLARYFQEKMGLELGQTSRDGRFTLLPVACLGACDRAPTLMIDEDLHGNVTPEKLPQILAKYE